MTISLNRAMAILAKKKLDVLKLQQDQMKSATVSYYEEDGEEFCVRPENSITDIRFQLYQARKDIRKLFMEISRVNMTETNFMWEGSLLTLGELILLIRQLRDDVPDLTVLKSYRSVKTKEKERIMDTEKNQMVTLYRTKVKEVLYNPKVIERDLSMAEYQIAQMQETINRYNMNLTIDFQDVQEV